MTDILPRIVEAAPPPLDVEGATTLVRRHYGLAGRVWSLGSHQDANFGVDSADGQWLFKVANRATPLNELAAHARVLERLARADPAFRLPAPRPGDDGECVQELVLDGEVHGTLLLSMVPGEPMMDSPYLASSVTHQIGELVGQLSVELSRLEVSEFPELERELQWGMRAAPLIVESLADHVPHADLRDRVLTRSRESAAVVAKVAESLPRQMVHGDANGNNIVFDRGADGRPIPRGFIDFGDASVGWAVWDLAVSTASVLHHRGSTVASVLPLVRAFDAVRPLSDLEIDSLWDLVVLRGCALVASSTHRLSVDADNDYARSGLATEIETFERATSVPTSVATAMLRHALDRPVSSTSLPSFGTMLPELPIEVDLSGDNGVWDDGNWLSAGVDADLLSPVSGVTSSRFAEFRLSQTRLHASTAPATCALHRELRGDRPRELHAPWSGVLRNLDGGWIVLEGGPIDVRVWGASRPASGAVSRGDVIGTIAVGTPVRLQCASRGVVPPLYVPPYLANAWLSVCPDPGPLLGLDETKPPVDDSNDMVARRDRTFATAQGHYYSEPPHFERGWREHMVDMQGRTYVDMVNNVTVLGHAHPAIVEAAKDQWARLNTNSRFNYASVVELSEKLVEVAPDGLDTVFLVSSGSEAVDLALRIAWAVTGRQDTVTLAESYHGWTYASDAVSLSLADNPNALGTRPAWVTVLDAPNSYRGIYAEDAAHAYAADGVATIDELAAGGGAAGAFISESFLGNAGGIRLPDGYLREIYAAIRRHGGLCVADEVQVGLGRLGDWFWGVDQQDVVPDILTIAKGLGNGHPVGAVITRRDIAEQFREEGSFFASTGGSPVSARVASTVLDVLRDEGLTQRAANAGVRLRAGLERLMSRHQIIGAVHGHGLYMGVELVRDRNTREPAMEEAYAICDRLLQLGVVCQPTSERNCVLKIKPPLVISDESCDHFIAALDEALTYGW